MSEELLRKALLRGACRLCMAPDTECVPIFATAAADKEPLPSKILACVSIKVTQTDRMSGRVCHACISYLNSWQSFKNRCHLAQKRHRGMLDHQIMRQRSLSVLGKAPAATSSVALVSGNVMTQQQILNHAAQQHRRQEAINNQRAQMRQQRILKEALTVGAVATGGAQKKSALPFQQLNSTAIDVSFIKDEPVDNDDDVTEVRTATGGASAAAAAVATGDADDDDDIVDPMQFLANDVVYNDPLEDDDDIMEHGDENGQPPILTSLGLTHINHNSDFDADTTAYEGDADDSTYMLPPNAAYRPGGSGGGGGTATQPKCTICNMKFSNRANARRHERNIHGKVSSDHGAAAAAAMLALSQNHQISITAPARPNAGGIAGIGAQQSLLLRNQAGMLTKRPSAVSLLGKPVFDYTQPKLYRELLTDAKLHFIKRHVEFLEQYQHMRCICCPRDFPTYKLFMAHMRKKYDTLSRNLCFKCLRQFDTKSLFIGHLKKKNCINLYKVYCADDTISKEPLPADTPSSNSLKAGTKEIIANKVYGCKLCDRTFRLKADFRSHVQVDHEQRRDGAEAGHGCAFCPIEFEDSAARKRHLNNLDCIVFLICGTCEHKFDTLALYIEHVYADHLPAAAAAAAAAAATAASSLALEAANADERSAVRAEEGAKPQQHQQQLIDTDTGEMLDNGDALNNSGELDAASQRLRNPSHCLVCNKLYNNYYNMLRHMESKHPDQLPRTYRCLEGCEVGYPRQSELREHMFQVHGITLPKTKREYYTCRLCGTVFDQRETWLDHQADAHLRFYCNLCDMETDERVELEAHLVAEHSTGDRGIGGGSSSLAASRANQCTICEHSFNSERGLETHLAVVHRLKRSQMPQRPVKVEEDGDGDDGDEKPKVKRRNDDGDGMDSTHNDDDDEDADDEANASAAALAPPLIKRFRPNVTAAASSSSHNNIHRSGVGAAASSTASPYRKCRLCGETFTGGVALANHMRTHGVMSIRPHAGSAALASRVPAHIGGSLANKSKVISRMRCRLCQKRIHTKTSYKRHMLNIHGVRDCVFIKCTVCPAEFSNDKGLKVHMFRTHHITVQQMQQDIRLRPVPKQESTGTLAVAGLNGTATAVAASAAQPGKEFECNLCHTVYRSREQLVAHQTLVHGGPGRDSAAVAASSGAVKDGITVKDEPLSEDDVEMIPDDDDDDDEDAAQQMHANQLLDMANAAVAAVTVAAIDPGECWWQCRYCEETFNASKKLTIHMNSHSEHDTTDHTCADCGNVYGTRKSLWVHRHKKHPRHPNPSACELCEKVFFDKTELFHHLKTHSNTDVFSHLTEMQTQIAEAEQQSKLTAAAVTVTASTGESCHICGQRFHDKRVLSKHLRLHEMKIDANNAESATVDAVAAAAAEDSGYIIPSYDGQMVDNEYACDMCPKTFPLMSALKVHRGWHFRSPDGRQVTDTANMWQPDRRASLAGQKRYRPVGSAATSSGGASSGAGGSRVPTCAYCKATFASGNNLRRHIVEVHKRNEARIIRENGSFSDKVQVERELECSQCDIILADRADWVEHKIGHARTMKPSTTFEWGCEICGKIFTRKERLLAHMVTHVVGGVGATGDSSSVGQLEGGDVGTGGGESRSSMSSQSQPAGGSSESRLRAQLQKPLEHPGTADSEGMFDGEAEEEDLDDDDDEDDEEGVEDEEEEDEEDDEEGDADDLNDVDEVMNVDEEDVDEDQDVVVGHQVGDTYGGEDDDDDDEDDENDEEDDEQQVHDDGHDDEMQTIDDDDDDDVEHDDVEQDDDDDVNDFNESPPKKYSCDLCQVFFKTAKDLRRHVASHILNGPDIATATRVAPSPSASSQQSNQSGHSDGFKCRLCGSSSESHMGMIRCMDAHKMVGATRCGECKLYFGDEEQRAVHITLCHPQKLFEE